MENQFEEITEQNPPYGLEVIGYHKSWIHPDFNADGIRICFRNDDDEWISAVWIDEQDYYSSFDTTDGNEKDPNTIYAAENTKPSHFFKIPKSPAERWVMKDNQ